MTYPRPTRIYHITHIDNLPNILVAGGLRCKSDNSGTESVSIAYENIQQRRAARAVPFPPKGTLHDYVPFYFSIRSPMLYTLSKGNVSTFQGSQADVIYLASTVQNVIDHGLDFVFTDGHAIVSLTQFYKAIDDLAHVDWQIIRSRQWFDNSDNPDRKRRKQAEFLVYRFFPWHCIRAVAVKNEIMQQRVQTALNIHSLAQQKPILLRPSWYY